MEDKLKFEPWISDHYKNGTAKFGKLLIVAESHYGMKNPPSNSTIDVLNDVVSNDRSAGYRMFTMMGHTINPQNRNELWENCAFSNLIQDTLVKPREYPDHKLLEDIHITFYNILDKVKPEKVIVTSKRAWNHWLPEEKLDDVHWCEHLIDHKITTDNPKIYSYLWRYHYDGGSCLAIGTNHPSTAHFYDWAPLIQKFVNTAY